MEDQYDQPMLFEPDLIPDPAVVGESVGACVAWQIYSDLMVISGSPRVTYYTGYMFGFNVNISSMYHIKTSVKVI